MLWFGWLEASLIIFIILIVFIPYFPPKNTHPLCISFLIIPKTRGIPNCFQNFDIFDPQFFRKGNWSSLIGHPFYIILSVFQSWINFWMSPYLCPRRSLLRERHPVPLRVGAGGRQRRGGAGVAGGAEDLGHHRGGHRGDAAALGKSTLHFTLTLCFTYYPRWESICLRKNTI